MVGTVFGCYLSRTFFAVIVNVKYVNKATLMQFNQLSYNCSFQKCNYTMHVSDGQYEEGSYV